MTLITILLMSGCAGSTVPALIRKPPQQNPSIDQVRKRPHAYIGTRIRWGGEIIRVENRTDTTWIELVSRPLWRSGRPKESDTSEGRFLARIQGFIDPAVYKKGRQLTVAGILRLPVSRPIGKFVYHYPVVEVTVFYLWPEIQKYRDDAYYHDPFWPYPWYPYYYPYPGYHHPWYRHY